MRSLFQDVRYGWRMLLKKPGFTVVTTLALALGIGANSAIFSIINAIVLKPLPFDDLDRIVMVWEKAPGPAAERNSVSVANYLDWRDQSNSFVNLAICMYWSANLSGIDTPERVRGYQVSPIDRDQPVFDVKAMAQVRDRMVMPFRILGILLSGFGVFALILAATGIYGVMAYAVSQRTREIGVRMALGARRGDILKLLVVGQGMWMTAIGIIIGLAGAIGLTQVLKGVLFGVNAIEAPTFAGVTLLLAVVSLLACYIPARRATKVDPMVALRYE
jgi:hypothetical protein